MRHTFCTFLFRHCTTATSHSTEEVHERRRYFLSLSELGCGSYIRNSTFRWVHLHLTKLVTSSHDRYEDWKNANSLFQRPVFAASPSSDLKVSNIPKSTPPQSIKAQHRGIRAGFVKWLLLVMCWEFHAQLRVLNFQWKYHEAFSSKREKKGTIFFKSTKKKVSTLFAKT